MKVYTSSYWKYRGDRGVQISNSKPADARVYRSLPTLYPSWEMVSAWNEVKKLPQDNAERIYVWSKFEREYWKKLNRIGPDNILPLLCDGDVYLCWCGKKSECHRGILATWLEKHGVEVEEL